MSLAVVTDGAFEVAGRIAGGVNRGRIIKLGYVVINATQVYRVGNKVLVFERRVEKIVNCFEVAAVVLVISVA